MKKIFISTTLIFSSFLIQSHTEVNHSKEFTSETLQNNCDASANLEDTCRNFISKCRKGGIHSEFPGQFYDVKIKIIKDGNTANHKKAWKLLNDNRFKK